MKVQSQPLLECVQSISLSLPPLMYIVQYTDILLLQSVLYLILPHRLEGNTGQDTGRILSFYFVKTSCSGGLHFDFKSISISALSFQKIDRDQFITFFKVYFDLQSGAYSGTIPGGTSHFFSSQGRRRA